MRRSSVRQTAPTNAAKPGALVAVRMRASRAEKFVKVIACIQTGAYTPRKEYRFK
jgi:hypothetical protein